MFYFKLKTARGPAIYGEAPAPFGVDNVPRNFYGPGMARQFGAVVEVQPISRQTYRRQRAAAFA